MAVSHRDCEGLSKTFVKPYFILGEVALVFALQSQEPNRLAVDDKGEEGKGPVILVCMEATKMELSCGFVLDRGHELNLKGTVGLLACFAAVVLLVIPQPKFESSRSLRNR